MMDYAYPFGHWQEPWRPHRPAPRQQHRVRPKIQDPRGDIQLRLKIKGSAYVATLTSPDDCKLADLHASLNGSTLIVEGSATALEQECELLYNTKAFDAPGGGYLGVLPAGTVINAGSAEAGWTPLQGGEAWVQDHGVLEPLRPPAWSPRSFAFSRSVQLPQDAHLEGARTSAAGGAFIVTIPKGLGCMPTESSPMNVAEPDEPHPQFVAASQRTAKRPTCGQAAQARPTRPAQPAQPAQPKSASPARRRPRSAPQYTPTCAALPASDPVLMECSSSDANIQQPEETTEEWEATSGGSFAQVV